MDVAHLSDAKSQLTRMMNIEAIRRPLCESSKEAAQGSSTASTSDIALGGESGVDGVPVQVRAVLKAGLMWVRSLGRASLSFKFFSFVTPIIYAGSIDVWMRLSFEVVDDCRTVRLCRWVERRGWLCGRNNCPRWCLIWFAGQED